MAKCLVVLVTVSLFFIMASTAELPAAAQTSSPRTIWSGVYTEAQAARGQADYQANCSACHGPDLSGVARLRGDEFMERWREFNVEGLFDFVSKSMPRKRENSPNFPGSLSEGTYTDIISFIFRSNGFPAGKDELTRAAMKTIQIEGKDGPKPVPNGALVQLVGCLVLNGTDWVLASASEPARTSSSSKSTPEELEAAQTKALGNQQFNIQNLGYLGASFVPGSHMNEKFQAKGYITRQPGNNRISVTSLESVSSSCR